MSCKFISYYSTAIILVAFSYCSHHTYSYHIAESNDANEDESKLAKILTWSRASNGQITSELISSFAISKAKISFTYKEGDVFRSGNFFGSICKCKYSNLDTVSKLGITFDSTSTNTISTGDSIFVVSIYPRNKHQTFNCQFYNPSADDSPFLNGRL